MGQHFDPVTRSWQPYLRVDYTDAAFRQGASQEVLIASLLERVVNLERRGA